MAELKLNLTLLVILISLISTLDPAESSMPRRAETMAYIEASCKTTLYQDLCIRCLSKFAHPTMENPQRLAQIALSVSHSRALDTRSFLSKVAIQLNAIKNNKDYFVVQDCLKEIDDSVEQLEQSIKELRWLNRPNPFAIDDQLLWHFSNVETWVSTALTDASTCVDSLPGHKMSKLKASIRVRAQNVAEMTSNALALFDGYAAQYKATYATRTTRKP